MLLAFAFATTLAAASGAAGAEEPAVPAHPKKLTVSLLEIRGKVAGLSNADTAAIIGRALETVADPEQTQVLAPAAKAEVNIVGELSTPNERGYRISFALGSTLTDARTEVAFDYRSISPVGPVGARKIAEALVAAALKVARKREEQSPTAAPPPATQDAVSNDTEGPAPPEQKGTGLDLVMKEPQMSGFFGINYWWAPYGRGSVAATLLPYQFPAFFIRYSRLELRGEIFTPEIKYLVGLNPANPVDLLSDCYVLLDFKWLFGQALVVGQIKIPVGYDYFSIRPLELPLLEHSMIGYELATQRRYARDLGAGIRGRLKLGKVLLTDDIAVINGQGQDRLDLNSNKDVYGRIGVKYGSAFSIGVSGGYFDDIFRGGEPYDRPDLNPDANTISVPTAGYLAAGDLDVRVGSYFRVIGEGMWCRLTKPAPNLTRWGFYGMAMVTFWHLQLAARYERFYDDPTNPYQLPDFAPMKERLTVGGSIFVWEGAPQTVQLQVNYQFDPPHIANNVLMFRLNFAFGEANRAYAELR